MLIPRYFFANDYTQFYDYFLSQPHRKRSFRKGAYLWAPGEPYGKIHYVVSGVAKHYAEHENGHRRIISFHGCGTVFPGYRLRDYKIELSLVTVALSNMEVLEFTKEEFRKMLESNSDLGIKVIDWYSMYVNRLLFETAHQEHNPTLTRISNLLYLLTENQPSHQSSEIDMSQDELADILGWSRVHVARGLAELRDNNIIDTSRKQIRVIDMSSLKKRCSSEIF